MGNNKDYRKKDLEPTNDEISTDNPLRMGGAWHGRPGESRIIYQDGDYVRYIYGHIVDETDWGIVLKRKYGKHRFAWSNIKRIDEPSTPVARS